MSTDDSVSRWIDELKSGQESATIHLWNRFYSRLIGLARQRLRTTSRRVVDEEDVVACAFETFFSRVAEGQFPRLHDRDDLWRLLIKITDRKATDQIRKQMRKKRGGHRVRGESVLVTWDASSVARGIDQFPDGKPTPDLAAAMTEGFRRLLDVLADDELRKIALMKLEGWTNDEIAQMIGRSSPTIERRLRLIREKWRNEL